MDIYRILMVGSVNKTILLGNLGRDPEIRSMQSGAKMASFSIATSKRWKDRNTQEQKEKTSWHNIVVFGDGLVDIVEKYVKKGSKIYVEGELQTRKWQDKDGNDRYTTEVILQGYNCNLTLLDSRIVILRSQIVLKKWINLSQLKTILLEINQVILMIWMKISLFKFLY